MTKKRGWVPPIQRCQATITADVFIPPGVRSGKLTFRCELANHDPWARSHQTTVDGKQLMFP